MNLKRLTDFIHLTHAVRQVERAIDVHGGGRAENDMEHSYQLALVAWYLNDRDHLHLNLEHLIGMALAHDLIEVHAGDTYAYASQAVIDAQPDRERQAIRRLQRDWPEFPRLHELIAEYEAGETAEAKLVYSIDKLLPMLNNYTDGGRGWRRKKVTLEQVKRVKTGKADRSPAIAPYFTALIQELENSPHIFADQPGPRPLNTSETDHHYLERAKNLAASSPEPIGCGVVIVQNGKIVAEATNSQRTDQCAVYHAEIKAIMEANRITRERTLPGATAYCSCEPCAMCLTALSYAKVERIVFDQRMIDLFPNDPQSQLDPYAYVQSLNFKPKLEQLAITRPTKKATSQGPMTH